MKKLVLVLLTLLLIGCNPGYEIGKLIFTYEYDFTKYSENNFLFTPEKYDGEYESVGLLKVEFFPPIKKNDNPESYSKYKQEEINTQEAIDSLYMLAKRMGADAIMNFKVEPTELDYGFMIGEGVQVKGFAIKRKNIK